MILLWIMSEKKQILCHASEIEQPPPWVKIGHDMAIWSYAHVHLHGNHWFFQIAVNDSVMPFSSINIWWHNEWPRTWNWCSSIKMEWRRNVKFNQQTRTGMKMKKRPSTAHWNRVKFHRNDAFAKNNLLCYLHFLL